MKHIFLSFFFAGLFAAANAQAYDTATLLKSRQYTAVGDYDNSLLLLKRLHGAVPTNVDLAKEYVQVSFLRRDYATALQIGEPMLTSPQADAQLYQVMAGVYNNLAQDKKMVATYESGIARFPKGGKLYAELGAHYAEKKKPELAIRTWEQGIANAPQIADNYYYALKYYSSQQRNPLKLALYGENYVLLDRVSPRSAEAKQLLQQAYYELFNGGNTGNLGSFGQSVVAGMLAQKDQLRDGYTAATYGAARKAFLTNWFAEGKDKTYPYQLFTYQKQLMDLNLWDAYHQWLLAPTAKGLEAYQTNNADAWKAFQEWFKKDIYRIGVSTAL